MRQNTIQKLRAASAKDDSRRPDTLDLNGLIDLVVAPKSKRALPTQRKYILSPEPAIWYVGAKGTAKTTAGAAKPLILSLLYPGSRHLIARWRWWSLEETTLRAFDACLDRLGRSDFLIHKEEGPPKKYWIASTNPEYPSEVVFSSLDDPDKVNSLEFTSITVDEANEIDETMASNLSSLLRFRRPMCDRAEGPYFLAFLSNPVEKAHWLHRKNCHGHPCDGGECDPNPMGVKIEPHPRENADNLPKDYYTRMAKGMASAMLIRYIEGKCGPNPTSGDAVYKNDFNAALHVADLHPVPGRPGIRGWDFGRRRPAVTWAQAVDGAVNYLKCELGDNEDLKDFAARILLRSQVEFPQIQKWVDYCDPHGTAQRDTGPSSVAVLRKLGLNPLYRDVGIEAGLGAVTEQLKTLVTVRGGIQRPQAQFDRVGCNIAIEGFVSGYVWGAPTPGGAKANKPKADGYYEHIMDDIRYIAVGLSHGATLPASAHRPVLCKRR